MRVCGWRCPWRVAACERVWQTNEIKKLCQCLRRIEARYAISKCTTSFNEVRNLAFQHVETLLTAIIRREPPPAVCPGEFVKITRRPPGQDKYLGEPGVCLGMNAGLLKLQLVGRRQRGVNMEIAPSAVKKITSDGQDVPDDGNQNNCGGCDKSSCEQQKCATNEPILDKAFLDSTLGALCSVNVAAMDAEHAECADLMHQLVAKKSIDTLKAVENHLAEHFHHEEALFDQHGWGQHQNEKLSAKKTHIEDHKRILRKISTLLESSAQSVPAEFIRELLLDFHNHTTRYDSQYADELGAKCAT